MRIVIALVAAFALAFWSLPAAQAIPSPVCTDATSPTCEGYVCVDANLDGRFQWNECEPRYCTCDPQPTPW